jgi:hypothetical protein
MAWGVLQAPPPVHPGPALTASQFPPVLVEAALTNANAVPMLLMVSICGSGFAPANGFVKAIALTGANVCAANETDQSGANNANINERRPHPRCPADPLRQFKPVGILLPFPFASRGLAPARVSEIALADVHARERERSAKISVLWVPWSKRQSGTEMSPARKEESSRHAINPSFRSMNRGRTPRQWRIRL